MKFQFMRVTQTGNPFDIADQCVWGGNDAELQARLLEQMSYYRGIYSQVHFAVADPGIIYFELNQLNFGHILTGFLSGGGGDFGTWVMGNCRIHLPFAYSSQGQYFYDMTRTEEEGSPRQTWSHGH